MVNTFYSTIEKSSAGIKSRRDIMNFVIQNPDFLPELATIAFDVNNKNHFKAVWIIEMIAQSNSGLLQPYIPVLCDTISRYRNHSAVRGISRTILFISESNAVLLTTGQEEKIMETCLDWLIRDERVATKVYAMYALCCFLDKYDWIKNELKNIIDKDYQQQSAAYKAGARWVLRKINRTTA